jgi:hypothetical protein
MRTIDEIMQELKDHYEAYDLIDMLDIPATVVVDRFEDYIIENREFLQDELFQED